MVAALGEQVARAQPDPTPPDSWARRQEIAQLGEITPNVAADFGRVLGTPTFIRSTTAFLTRRSGRTATQIVADFVNDNPATFGASPGGGAVSGATSAADGGQVIQLRISEARPSDQGRFTLVISNACAEVISNPVDAAVPCDPDVNRDGSVDQDDVEFLVGVIAGGPNPVGTDPDFNRDGNVDQDDVLSYINYVGGAGCP